MITAFIQRAVVQGIPLLFGSTGEILTEKSGNLNLGIPGIMYVGGISGVIGAFLYEQSLASPADLNTALAILIPTLSCILGSLLAGFIYAFLTITLRANQNVTGLALTTFGVGFGNFFGGSLIKLSGSDMPSIALTATSNCFRRTLPFSGSLGWFGEIFLSYSFLAYAAILIALICSHVLNRTRVGLQLRSVGESPSTADAAGINVGLYTYAAPAWAPSSRASADCTTSWTTPTACGPTTASATGAGWPSPWSSSPCGSPISAFWAPSSSAACSSSTTTSPT